MVFYFSGGFNNERGGLWAIGGREEFSIFAELGGEGRLIAIYLR